MPTTGELDALAKRRARGALVGLGVLALIVTIALVGILSQRSGPSSPSSEPSFAPTPPASVQPTTAADPPGYVRPARWAHLPEGTVMLADRFPVRFPHSPAGASSAAAALYQSAWTVDFAAAAKAVQVYVAPASRAATRSEARQGVSWFRDQIGVDDGSALPPEASILVQPTGVRWTPLDADNVVVNLNLEVTLLASREQPVTNASAAVTVLMRWHPDLRNGDWLAVRKPVDQMPALRYAELGTADFNELGWTAVKPTETG